MPSPFGIPHLQSGQSVQTPVTPFLTDMWLNTVGVCVYVCVCGKWAVSEAKQSSTRRELFAVVWYTDNQKVEWSLQFGSKKQAPFVRDHADGVVSGTSIPNNAWRAWTGSQESPQRESIISQ